MPAVMVPSAISPLRHQLLVLVEHARHVGQEKKPLRTHGAGDSAREGVRVDVVGLPVRAGCEGRQDRDQLGLQHRVENRAIHVLGLADEAEIDRLLGVRFGIDRGAHGLACPHHHAVLARQADGAAALRPDPADDLLVDGAGEDHLDHLDGRLVRDPQAAGEGGLNAELVQHLADLRAAAVNDDRLHAGLLQQHDVLGEILRRLAVPHGVAAILDDDHLLVVALHVRQGLHEHLGAHVGVGEWFGHRKLRKGPIRPPFADDCCEGTRA
jgi:hypothetical protein